MAGKRRKSQLWVARVESMFEEYPERLELLNQADDLNDGFKKIKAAILDAPEAGRYILLRQVSDVLTGSIERTAKVVLLDGELTSEPLPTAEDTDQEVNDA